MGPRVLIIKLGALGDVVRTGCLLPGLAAWPEPPFVTWLTSPAACPLVSRMPGVHRVLALDTYALAHLELEHFDLALSLDKEPAPCAVALRVKAERRLGIGLSRYGTVFPLNEECDYYFRLGLDNEEKFHRNPKSYPELIYEALGMTYGGERYGLELTPADRAHADARLGSFKGLPRDVRWVGINAGAGSVFANKAWREQGYVELIHELARRRPEVAFLLLGGPDEAALMERIARAGDGLPVFPGGPDNPLTGFAALIERCAVLLTGDTMALHLAVALRRRVVAIFGPTCAQEIDLFGQGEKIVTPIDCSPCYRRQCEKSPSCQDLISAQTVLEAVERQLEAGA
jgi:heptosyltransferase-2